ncbi:MAG: hypothetical protein ACLGI6_17370 [Gammaproteobacteria bacterium]
MYIKALREAPKHGYAADEISVMDDSFEKPQRQPSGHFIDPRLQAIHETERCLPLVSISR